MRQQGIYAAPNTNGANCNREEVREKPRLWVIDYTVNEVEGVAVVKAYNPKRVGEILESESKYNSYKGKFKIVKIEEILESPDEMLIMEATL